MIDALKRTLYLGVGLAVLTKERLVELGKDISKQADLTESQANEFQEELQQKATEAKDQLQAEIDRRVEAVMHRLGVAKADQVNALLSRIEALEAKVGGGHS